MSQPPAEDVVNNVKWIFFDLGWTLVDETEAHRVRLRATQEILAEMGLTVSVDELLDGCERAGTKFAPGAFWHMLDNLALAEEKRRIVTDRVRSGARGAYGKEYEVLFRGVPKLLNELSTRYRLGVIANQSEGTERRLTTWGVRDHFSLVLASAELGLSKPDPEIFRHALSIAQCGSNEAVMVGDRLDNDIGPARAEGWQTVRVRQGFFRFQEPRNSDEKPDLTIDHIGQLTEHLL